MFGECSADQARATGLQLGEELRQGRLPQALGGLYALQQSADCILLPKHLPPRDTFTFCSSTEREVCGRHAADEVLRTSRKGWPHLNTRARVQVGAQYYAD